METQLQVVDEVQVLASINDARLLVILNDSDCERAAEMSKNRKALENEIKNTFKVMKSKARGAWIEICDQENKYLEPVIEAQRIIDQKVSAFISVKNEQIRQEQVKREEAARKQAEEMRLQQAIKLEKEGKTELANSLIEKPLSVNVAKAPEAKVQVEGYTITKFWQFEVTNPDLIPREYMMPDEKKLGQVARAMKEQANIPGVRVYSVDSARKRIQ